MDFGDNSAATKISLKVEPSLEQDSSDKMAGTRASQAELGFILKQEVLTGTIEQINVEDLHVTNNTEFNFKEEDKTNTALSDWENKGSENSVEMKSLDLDINSDDEDDQPIASLIPYHMGFDYRKISGQKNYTSTKVKEEPVESIKKLFKKNRLKYEKENFHQQIVEKILENSFKINTKDFETEYIDHLREISSVEVFSCGKCDYQTINETNLKCHLFLIHNTKSEKKDLFRCNRCEYETYYQNVIAKHVATHEIPVLKSDNKEKHSKKSGEKHPCSQCSYQARSEEALDKHLVSHKQKNYTCDLCSFEGQDSKGLKKHKDTHRLGKKYLCYKCDYKNNNKLVVGLHLLNVHKIANETSKRSKMCEICSFAFSNIYQLQRHYVTHKDISELSESEIYKCTECDHKTKYKTNFQLHMRMHQPPEFICEICGFSTKHKRSYENHLITHKKLEEIEWFRCEICPYQARNKKLLYKHMKTGNHSGKKLLHVRNRDRLREAQEKGLPIEDVIRKYKIKQIGGIKIKRERILKPSTKERERKRRYRMRLKMEKAMDPSEIPETQVEGNVVPLSRIHEVLPKIINTII